MLNFNGSCLQAGMDKEALVLSRQHGYMPRGCVRCPEVPGASAAVHNQQHLLIEPAERQ
jgi:hypothetical protein